MRSERQNCNWPDCQHDDERCFFGIGAPCETPMPASPGDIIAARRSARIAWTVTLAASLAYLGYVIAGAAS